MSKTEFEELFFADIPTESESVDGFVEEEDMLDTLMDLDLPWDVFEIVADQVSCESDDEFSEEHDWSMTSQIVNLNEKKSNFKRLKLTEFEIFSLLLLKFFYIHKDQVYNINK